MIVGTAGHVDHGKTTLVHALTGVDTDRLKEEKTRGITIDLGFAYMPGPEGTLIGFVDVPGHESLVRTMVAGAAGIDFALLVVAADEGIRPQTREHLDVLDLLGIGRGLVVVTKSDRADDEQRNEVRRDIASTLRGHPLAGSQPLFVSARTGDGMDALCGHLVDAARHTPSLGRGGMFRLAVDRAFTLKGLGTVVAGTAIAGRVRVDDEVTLLPSQRRARVRSLHVQNREADEGSAGQRCALALAGIGRDDVSRGSWVCGAAAPAETTRFDATLRLLPGEPRPLRQWTPAHLHCGASDVPARIVVLSSETLVPGDAGVAQIVLTTPLPLRHGDRFVLRDTSARRTIGGGKVLAPRASPRRRRTPDHLRWLAALDIDEPATALSRLLAAPPFFEDLAAFLSDRDLRPNDGEGLIAAHDLAVEGDEPPFVMTKARRAALDAGVIAALADHHAAHPELPGMSGEQLRQKLAPMPPKPLFAALRLRLLAERRIASRGHWLHLPTHTARLSDEDQRIAHLAMPLVEKNRFRPPRVRDVGAIIGFHETRVRHACKALVRSGILVEIAADHFFKRETVAEMADIARDLTERAENGQFTAADFRDRLDDGVQVAGRKVAIQILEFFDRHGLTHRSGDLRRVVKAPAVVFGERGGENHVADRV